MSGPTPGQTIGPFFGYALPFGGDSDLVPAAHPDAVRLTGRVLDGAGEAVPDALVEIRQADATGVVPRRAGSLHRDGYTFTGWGRCATDATGRFGFTTVRPAAADGAPPPFIALTVFARGLLDRLFTRIYLPGTEPAWDDDPQLVTLPPARRRTLVASARDGALHFDVRLQGQDETVFFEYTAPS